MCHFILTPYTTTNTTNFQLQVKYGKYQSEIELFWLPKVERAYRGPKSYNLQAEHYFIQRKTVSNRVVYSGTEQWEKYHDNKK